MQVTIVEYKQNRFIFTVEGATHTLCNALKTELWKDTDVKTAGYHIDHPLVGMPKFIVETKKGVDAKKTVSAALKKLSKQASDLAKKSATVLK